MRCVIGSVSLCLKMYDWYVCNSSLCGARRTKRGLNLSVLLFQLCTSSSYTQSPCSYGFVIISSSASELIPSALSIYCSGTHACWRVEYTFFFWLDKASGNTFLTHDMNDCSRHIPATYKAKQCDQHNM